MKTTNQCCADIYNGIGVGFRQCIRTGSYEHEGKFYCKTHYPPNAQKRHDDLNRKWEIEGRIRTNGYLIKGLKIKIADKIIENPPEEFMGMVKEIQDFYDQIDEDKKKLEEL